MRPKLHKILLLSKLKSFGNLNGPVEMYPIFRSLKFLQDGLLPNTDTCTGVDPGFFLGGGAPLRNDVTDGEVKKKEIKTEHVYTKTRASFQREGGVRTPCILLLDLPL